MAIYTNERDPNVIQWEKEKKSFIVTINWVDTKGNPRTSTDIIKSDLIELAMDKLKNRVKKYKSFQKLNGGDAQLIY